MTEAPTANESRNKGDEAASAACIRSGAFALFLSLTLILLIPYWIEQPRYWALDKYVAGRFNLASSIESLDDDANWKSYLKNNPQAESSSISQLQSIQIGTPQVKIQKPKPVPSTDTGSGKHPTNRPPAPPTGFSVSYTMELPEFSRIKDALHQLNDSETLTRTRDVSNYFNLSVARWANKRGALAYQNAMPKDRENPCFEIRDLEAPRRKNENRRDFVPALTEDALMKCLTLADIHELARFEEPTVSNPIELGGRIVPMIEFAPGSLPRGPVNLNAATISVLVLLFFVIMYFGAFAREAVAAADFPVPGTLFSAFSKSRSTLVVLLIALWTPLVASTVLAFISRGWPHGMGVVLIGAAIASVYSVLAAKAYFRPLDPRPIFQAMRSRRSVELPVSSTETNQSSEPS